MSSQSLDGVHYAEVEQKVSGTRNIRLYSHNICFLCELVL